MDAKEIVELVEKQKLINLREAYNSEKDPSKKKLLLAMYNYGLQLKQKEVIERDYFVR